MDKFYFTHPAIPLHLRETLHDALDSGEHYSSPDSCQEGDLYEVTIKKVGIVREVTEVEMFGEGNG